MELFDRVQLDDPALRREVGQQNDVRFRPKADIRASYSITSAARSSDSRIGGYERQFGLGVNDQLDRKDCD